MNMTLSKFFNNIFNQTQSNKTIRRKDAFVINIFNAAGSNFFGDDVENSNAQKLFRGSEKDKKLLNSSMKGTFPNPINRKGLIAFFNMHILEHDIATVASNFDISNSTKIQETPFFEALCDQFECFIKPDAGIYVDNVVSKQYFSRISLKPSKIKTIGRDDIISEISEKLYRSAENKYAVEVTGSPGVGKTTVCKEVMAAYNIDAETIIMAKQFRKADALVHIMKSLGKELDNNFSLEDNLKQLYKHEPNLTIYFDNMEDPLKDKEFEEWFSGFVADSGWNIMYSSWKKITPKNGNIVSVLIPTLDAQAAKKMFLSLWGDLSDNNERDVDSLLSKIRYHPLCIKIFAAQKKRQPSISELLKEWRNINSLLDNSNEDSSHRSLRVAHRMSFNAVKGNSDALIVWGVLSFFPVELSYDLYKIIFDKNIDKFDIAVQELEKISLISIENLHDDSRGDLFMLPSTKSVAFDYDNDYREKVMSLLGDALIKIFRERSNLTSKYLHTALDFLANEFLNLTLTEQLAHSMRQHYRYLPLASVSVLLSVNKKLTGGNLSNRIFSAYLNNELGRLYHKLRDKDNSRFYFERSNELYAECIDEMRKLQFNTLMATAEMESMIGNEGDARWRLENEITSSKTKDLLRGANAHLLLGKLYFSNKPENKHIKHRKSKKGKMELTRAERREKSRQEYKEAERLYRERISKSESLGKMPPHGALIGLADTLSAQGELTRRDAGDIQKKVENLQQSKHSELANELLVQKKELEQTAYSLFTEAEEIYRDKNERLRLSVVLRHKGFLYVYSRKTFGFFHHLDEAAEIARDEDDKFALADILTIKGHHQRKNEFNYTQAYELYKDALALYMQEGEHKKSENLMAELLRVSVEFLIDENKVRSWLTLLENFDNKYKPKYVIKSEIVSESIKKARDFLRVK